LFHGREDDTDVADRPRRETISIQTDLSSDVAGDRRWQRHRRRVDLLRVEPSR